MAEINKNIKSSMRKKADEIKKHLCKNLIVVIENPRNFKNIGTIVRNVNALGAEKVYIIDTVGILPKDWQDMRNQKGLLKTSVSAIKWSFVRVFEDTQSCINHLEKKNFISAVTSPHIKGQNNIVLHEGDYTQKKLAVWFGTESHGISDLAVENSEICINIPMFGMIESLNLGTSTGIVLYEITKQRREFQNTHKRSIRNKITDN